MHGDVAIITASLLNKSGRLVMNDEEKIKFGKLCGYPAQEAIQISTLD